MSVAKKPLTLVVDGEIGAGKSTLVVALAEELKARGFNVCRVLEPVAKWQEVGILGRFYSDPVRYAYEFQTYTFVTRIDATRQAWAANPSADIYILERSVFTDRYIFMELQKDIVGSQTMQMYNEWCELHKLLMPLNLAEATYLYLKPDLPQCMGRVEGRARKEEICRRGEEKKPSEDTKEDSGVLGTALPGRELRSEPPAIKPETPGKGGVSLEYQQKLRKAHEILLQGLHGGPSYARPFPLSSVVVMEGPHANADFTEKSPDRAKVVRAVADQLLGKTPHASGETPHAPGETAESDPLTTFAGGRRLHWNNP